MGPGGGGCIPTCTPGWWQEKDPPGPSDVGAGHSLGLDTAGSKWSKQDAAKGWQTKLMFEAQGIYLDVNKLS